MKRKKIMRIGSCFIIMTLLISTFSGLSFAANRLWESAYTTLINNATKKMRGGMVHLVDLDYNGTPEVLIGWVPGSAAFSSVVEAYTYKNDSTVSLSSSSSNYEDYSSTALSAGGEMLGETIDQYALYRNNATGQYKTEGFWLSRDSIMEYDIVTSVISISDGKYLSQSPYRIHSAYDLRTNSDIKQYYLNGTLVDYSTFSGAFKNRNSGWTKISDFSAASKYFGSSPTKTEIANFLASYQGYTFPRQVGSFTDVMSDAYYADPVAWAVKYGITEGTSATTFSPDAGCTRDQVVTFLWRAAGQPEPQSGKNPFTDVSSSAYYYKPVLWAVEQGITQGTSDTTFSPNGTCTRGQIVTFLHRYAGNHPVTNAANPFADVLPSDYYYTPVLWAAQQNITQGTADTTFSPSATCTRGQIVTFLYRYMG